MKTQTALRGLMLGPLWKTMHTLWCLLFAGGIFVGSALASDPIVYSGANRNVVYNQFTFQPAFSLFDAPGTWDNVDLDMFVFQDPLFQNAYTFGNMLQVHGNFVEFAVGAYFFDIKRFSTGQMIGPAHTFSGDNYKDFSNYWQEFDPFPYTSENGEFRNASGYAGIRMKDGTNTYYGWIQVSVADYSNANITGTLIHWAYNSVPGSPILAGMTNSPAITSVDRAVAITWPALSNVLYQVQATASLSPPAWANTGAPILGTGSPVTFFQVATNNFMSYRLLLAQ